MPFPVQFLRQGERDTFDPKRLCRKRRGRSWTAFLHLEEWIHHPNAFGAIVHPFANLRDKEQRKKKGGPMAFKSPLPDQLPCEPRAGVVYGAV